MALTLFDNITEKLTDYEKQQLVPLLLSVLQDTHENRRITAKKICEWFMLAGVMGMSETRVRKMVNYIRQMNLCSPAVLIGASNHRFTDRIPELQRAFDDAVAWILSMTSPLHD